ILSFILLFTWIRKESRKDPKEEDIGIFLMIVVAFVLALILSGVAAFFLFIVLGSTSIITTLFTLDMSRKDLILMSLVYLVFIFSLDNVFQLLLKMLVKNLFMFYFIMLWLRMTAFYLIGSFFYLPHMTNLIIS